MVKMLNYLSVEDNVLGKLQTSLNTGFCGWGVLLVDGGRGEEDYEGELCRVTAPSGIFLLSAAWCLSPALSPD